MIFQNGFESGEFYFWKQSCEKAMRAAVRPPVAVKLNAEKVCRDEISDSSYRKGKMYVTGGHNHH